MTTSTGPTQYFGEHVLLASDPGRLGPGGLFLIDENGAAEIDRLSTTGLALIGGDNLVRVVRTPIHGEAGGELLVYDTGGVLRYLRVDGVSDVHDVAWDGTHFIVAATGDNALVWLDEAGRVIRVWRPDGSGDAWHLNTVLLRNERLLAGAFGRFDRHRDWSTPGAVDGCGIVLDVETGADVVSALSCPHSARELEDGWVLCNSAENELLVLDTNDAIQERIELNGWTRGVASNVDYVFVGESADRKSPSTRSATVAVIDRAGWSVVDRIEVPGSGEIYDLVLLPPALAEGVAVGFRTNPERQRPVDAFALFGAVGVEPPRTWAPGDPIARADLRARLTADVPPTMSSASIVDVSCVVENTGRAVFSSAPPHPVHVSYRWFDVEGERVPAEPLRTSLPDVLPPHTSAAGTVSVRTPSDPGIYTLRITLVQELVAWFDEVDAACAFDRLVEVRPLQQKQPATAAQEHPEPDQSDPLPGDAFLVHIDAPELGTARAGATLTIDCTVTNLGRVTLRSAPPHPVLFSYRIFDAQSGRFVAQGPRTAFDEPLGPGGSATLPLEITAPEQSGSYLVGITLVQELVAWFDDREPSSSALRTLRVRRR